MSGDVGTKCIIALIAICGGLIVGLVTFAALGLILNGIKPWLVEKIMEVYIKWNTSNWGFRFS